MWFGDYPDYPAYELHTGELLRDVLGRHEGELLGKKVIEKLGGQLPYLPKVYEFPTSNIYLIMIGAD